MKHVSNADRIRAMTDDELMHFICAVVKDCEGCKWNIAGYCTIDEWLENDPAPEPLKPCPFCGGEASVHKHDRFGVECEECGAGFGCVKTTEAEAREAWNRRIDNE